MQIRYQPMMSTTTDKLNISVYRNRHEIGAAAAEAVAACMRELLSKQQQVRMVFAAAPSQNEFLQAIKVEPLLDWSRVSVFHMDEYIGLPADAPQLFGRFLKESIWDEVNPGEVHLIDGLNDPIAESKRYGQMIAQAPIDIICLGIGENGHIAFNDPPVANFHDTEVMKLVMLDEACRQQQVNDGCFPSIADVPKYALTLTIPTMMSGVRLFCIVPGITKQAAVREMLTAPISTVCPATILRSHLDCIVYLDQDSYGVL